MKQAHLTSVERDGERAWKATCLCGWECVSREWSKVDAHRDAKEMARAHWMANPVGTDIEMGR